MSKSDFKRLRPSQRVNRRRGVFCRRASALLNCILGFTGFIALIGVGVVDRSETKVVESIPSVHERAAVMLPLASLAVIQADNSAGATATGVPAAASLPVVQDRISADQRTNDFLPTASLKAAAWGKVRGKLFAAAICASDLSVSLGCARLDNVERLSVRTVPIRSQTEEDKAALATVRRLDGLWQGEGYALRIDGGRAQANMDSKAPFDWRRFLIKRIWKDTVVFSLDAELFHARLSETRIILTGTSFRGERVLTRS
jgi:hypothetical protein